MRHILRISYVLLAYCSLSTAVLGHAEDKRKAAPSGQSPAPSVNNDPKAPQPAKEKTDNNGGETKSKTAPATNIERRDELGKRLETRRDELKHEGKYKKNSDHSKTSTNGQQGTTKTQGIPKKRSKHTKH